MAENVWYFAYGSNLNKKQMVCRTGHLRESQRASLPGYRFVFNKLSKDETLKASIEPAAGETVHGVVYWCTPEDMKQIDKSEGANIGHYSRETIEVIDEDGSPLEAEVYIACEEHICECGSPSEDYVDRIVTGAKEHGLPAEAVDIIRRAAGR